MIKLSESDLPFRVQEKLEQERRSLQVRLNRILKKHGQNERMVIVQLSVKNAQVRVSPPVEVRPGKQMSLLPPDLRAKLERQRHSFQTILKRILNQYGQEGRTIVVRLSVEEITGPKSRRARGKSKTR